MRPPIALERFPNVRKIDSVVGSTNSQRPQMSISTDPVIDCDSHVMEPPDLWEKYLEPQYRGRAIRIKRDPVGMEVLCVDNEPPLKGGLGGLGGAHVDRTKVFVP